MSRRPAEPLKPREKTLIGGLGALTPLTARHSVPRTATLRGRAS